MLRRFWDAHSNGWNEMRSTAEARAHVTTVVGWLTGRLTPAATVVDLGCGAGHYAVEAASRGFDVIGLDYSPAMLALARRHAADAGVAVDLRECDLDVALPLEHESVDAAMLVSVLQVAHDPDRLLADVATRLRPGGYLLIESVRQWGALSHGKTLRARDRLTNAAKKATVKLTGAAALYTPDDIATLCSTAGLEIVDDQTYEPTFAVLARKLPI